MRKRRRGSALAAAAHPLVQGLDADLARAYAPAGRLVRELNPAGAIAFQLLLACNVLAALVHPLFMAGLGYSLLAAPPLKAIGSCMPRRFSSPRCFAGYASTIAIDLIGLKRRTTCAPRLGADPDAAVLVPAVARGLARAVSAPVRSAALGKDRTRAGAQFAPVGRGWPLKMRPKIFRQTLLTSMLKSTTCRWCDRWGRSGHGGYVADFDAVACGRLCCALDRFGDGGVGANAAAGRQPAEIHYRQEGHSHRLSCRRAAVLVRQRRQGAARLHDRSVQAGHRLDRAAIQGRRT